MSVPMWTFVSLASPVLDLLSAPHSWAHVHFDVWNLIFLKKFPPYLPFMCLSCCCCICVFEQWRHCFTNLRLLSGAPSLVEVRQLFLLQYFADFPHTRVNMFALQNSTNTTKNFQNTNYPFTSHSFGERSPKVSIWRLKYKISSSYLFIHWTIQNMKPLRDDLPDQIVCFFLTLFKRSL